MIRYILPVLISISPLSAQWGANSQPTRTTGDHAKRIIGYVTQWDAWKSTDAGLPKQGFLNHLNLDYSQYTHLNYSFFGVANDGSLHSGDYRNPNIHQAGSVQSPAPLLNGDLYSSWDYHLLWGNLSPLWEINATAQAAGFIAFNGGWKHSATGLTGQLPVPYHPPGTAPGILELAHSKGVKVMASIGGWSMCKHFPETAADPVKRARFIADCQKLIALGFDGIDLDWEYPGPFDGMNFTGSQADYANFLTLITELRTAIGSQKEITSATSASPTRIAGFNWPAVSAVLDSVNLMTYDFEGGWSDNAGHNAQLHPHPGQESTSFSCATSVQYLINQDVPRSKIAMGLSFYGRGVICDGHASFGAPTVKVPRTIQPDGPVVTAADFATWEPFDATPTYQRITQLMGSGWTRQWDDVSKAPYLTKGSLFLSYDDSRSIGHKAAYVRQQALGGVIVWHAYGDLRAGAITNTSDKLPFSPTTDAPLINVVNSVLAGDAIPDDGQEGPSAAGGPPRGLSTLPNRPLVFGYLNALRNASGQDQVISDFPTALQAANLEAFDVIITAFAEPLANGSIGTGLGEFASYLPAVVNEGHALGKSVVVSIGGAYPAALANQFATIAASPTLRQTFANNVVSFLQNHHLDGVDIDYEFPADATARANFTLLMQTLHATVKAADSRYIVFFGGGPGWYLGSFNFADLHPYCDFFFYFGYDWKNPANGPLRKPGSIQWTQAGDTLTEASVKGGIDYVLSKGFPASKIICGLPFYGSNNTSWSAVRNTWQANQAAYPTDANSLEVQINGEWFTPPTAMKSKMDVLLDPALSVLTGGAVIRGVGCWEIGHEHASHPDLSTAFAEWIAGEPTDPGPPPDPPLDPEAGWTSHATSPLGTLTLTVTEDWGSGFGGELRFTNNTGATITSWTLAFDAPFAVGSLWNGVYGGKSGVTHSVSNPTWGGYSLANGGTGVIGFTGSGPRTQPTNLRLNGSSIGNSGTPFATWASSRSLPPTNLILDSDGDGRSNLIEFLNGSNPQSPDTGGIRNEIRNLTVGGVPANYFCIIVPAATDAANVEYRVLSAPVLSFSNARVMTLHGTQTTGANRVEAIWRDNSPIGNRGFARVEARLKP
jgi:GH18 family chitinase